MRILHTKRTAAIASGVGLLVLLGVIAGGVWFVQSRSTPMNSAGDVVRIKELGIQMTVPDSIKDLRYMITTIPLDDGRQATLAGFTTTTLAARDPGCSPENMPLGNLGSVLGQYPTDDPYAKLNYGILVKQFPTFYVSAGAPQGTCSSNPATQELVSEDRMVFREAVSTIQPLQ